MALNDQELTNYYASQNGQANPLSPTAYEASIRPKPITSEALQWTDVVKLPEVQKPNDYIPDQSGLLQKNPYEMTPEQKRYQDISDSILKDMELQQTANKEKAGMELSQLTPLQAQESQFINEQNALINEQKAIPGNIQNEFAGKGATAGGVSPFEMAAKRKNLQDIYLNQAKIDAVRGNITSAQNYINKSLEAKYGDIQANIDYKIKALGVIQASPEYTLAEKKQAAAALAQEEARKQALADQKTTETSIKNLELEAVKNGAQIDTNKTYKTFDEALSALAPSLRTANNEVVKVGDNAYLIDKNTGKVIQSFIAPSTGGGGGFNLTPNQRITQEQTMATKLKANTATAKELQRQYSIMKTALDNIDKGGSLNAGTQAIVKTYNLILEPSSVVRETEYAMSADGQSLLDKMSGSITKLESGGGGITKENLKSFGDMAKSFLENSQKSANEEIVRTGNAAQNYGLDINNIMTPSQKGIYAKESQKMSDSEALDMLLTSKGLKYEDVLNSATAQRKPGETMIIDRITAQPYMLEPGDVFDGTKYIKL